MNQQDKDRLREYANNLMRFANADFGELVLSLLEENEALARDSARYRWLREYRSIEIHVNPSVPWVVRCEFLPTLTIKPIIGFQLDAAIDTAMQSKGE